jgi:hypothetical protein
MVINITSRRQLRQHIQSKATVLQQAELQERRVTLRHRIERWQDIQGSYMPSVTELRLAQDLEHPEAICLYLPSALQSPSILPCELQEKEKRLRLAQAEDTLVELKRLLRISMSLQDYKIRQIGPSQRANTRARSMITRFREKINRCADRYRAAHSALTALDPGGSWDEEFLELRQEHVRGPGRALDDQSEGRRELSWIWLVQPLSDDGASTKAELDDGECLNR